MALLDDIILADKKPLKAVEVPDWGLTVYIKQLTVGERDSYESEIFNASKERKGALMDDPRSKFLFRTLCDSEGKPLCKEYSQLKSLSSRPMELLFQEAQKVNRLTDEDIEELSGN